MQSNTAPVQVKGPVRPHLEVADIFRSHGQDYRKEHSLTTEQLKAMRDIQQCRTVSLGGHVDVCHNGCGFMRISYNSCRNRNCPKCQSLQSAQWLQKRIDRMLPTEYFHVVITFPHQLNPLILQNQQILYPIIFQAAAQSLLQLARDWKGLKAQVGFTAILHTWNQNMLFHPHLHMVVTAGGLDQSQTRWISSTDKFLVPVAALSKKIRGKFLHLLKRAWNQQKLVFRGTIDHLRTHAGFAQFINELYGRKWHAYVKRPFSGPEQVFRYLSQYTHRVAISNQRLLEITDSQVTFAARDNHNPGEKRTVTVSAEEFIRRFLLHVLPAAFVKIRHYGLMAPCNAKTKLETARKLIHLARPRTAQDLSEPNLEAATQTWHDLFLQLTGVDPMRCPKCRKGILIRQPLSILQRNSRTRPPAPMFLDSS